MNETIHFIAETLFNKIKTKYSKKKKKKKIGRVLHWSNRLEFKLQPLFSPGS
jgi:hypothetical protein